MSQATKKPKKPRGRERSDGVWVVTVSVEMPETLYDQLSTRAESNLRSLSSEVVSMLRESIAS